MMPLPTCARRLQFLPARTRFIHSRHRHQRLSPPLPHTRSNVETGPLAGHRACSFRSHRPPRALEQRQQRIRDEARSRCIEVPISVRAAAKKLELAGLLDCVALVAEAAKETEPDRRRLSIVAMEAVCRSRIIS